MTPKQRWNAANPEKRLSQSKLAQARWISANPDKAREQSKERNRRWRMNNSEGGKENARRYYVLHKEERLLIARVKRKNNPGQRPTERRWKEKNPHVVHEMATRRRARKFNQLGVVSPNIVKILFAKQDGYCNNLLCNADLVFEDRRFELDHKMPLALGGLHDDSNLQLLCARCNRRKSAKHPDSGWEA